MMLKHLHRLMFSITSSITRDLAARPMVENSPVSGPNTKKEAATEAMSTNMRTVPMFKLVCFFRIMAIMSVPPLDAPMWNRMAVLMAGRKMANISSKSGSVVSGRDSGQRLSLIHISPRATQRSRRSSGWSSPTGRPSCRLPSARCRT